MNLITTTQLARKLNVTTQLIQKRMREKRMKPTVTLANGHHLWLASTKLPPKLPHGPKGKA